MHPLHPLALFVIVGGICLRTHCLQRNFNLLGRIKRSSSGFDYDGKDFMGPHHWSIFWHECEGSRQSPIDIPTSKAIYYPFNLNFLIEGCNFRGKFMNNGHAPTFTLNDMGTQISGLPNYPTEVFELYNFHFHFGHNQHDGSEHSVDGRKYAGEMHMVHYNTRYETFAKAVDKPDGLAVLGVFLQGCNKTMNRFDRFISHNGRNLRYINGHISTKFNPFILLPKSQDSWFYKGSLTTPGCFQSVNWVLFRKPVIISTNTLKVLREMETSYHHEPISLMGNCRPQQPIHGRKILRNFNY